MVVLHIKKGEESLFLYETPAQTPLAKLVPDVAKLHNFRLRLKRLVSAAEDLIAHGPLKPESEQGYTEEQLESLSLADKPPVEKKEVVKNGVRVLENPDPTGRRTGDAPPGDIAEIIRKTLTNASAVIGPEMIKSNKCQTEDMLQEALDGIRGATMIAYPMGLPEWEPVREILEDNEDLSGTAASKEVVDPDTATLWWAGKELVREKLLSDFTGKNEKTKIIVKIQKKGQGPPLREAPMSEQAQKEMMAYYYRKQEEHKKLAANDEDDYLNSTWANPKALKSAFTGIGSNVSWRPK
ncbi:hypothetical protein HK104_006819 [Borealophlyctis nickersoniae]|nr:hypothetical protein HK104_006819 [Borealophlyctis nickersoniae]